MQSVQCAMWYKGSVVWFVAGTRHFSLLQNIWTGPGAYPASYLKGTTLYLQLKRMGHESDCSYPPSSGLKNEQSYTSRPPYAFVVCKERTLPFIPLSSKWSLNFVHISHVFHMCCIPTYHTILTTGNEAAPHYSVFFSLQLCPVF
jgi:hypothetical protein